MSMIDRNLFFQVFGSGDFAGTWNDVFGCDDDRRVIVALARHIRPKVVIEYGIQAGRTAKTLLAEVPGIERYVGIDAQTIDMVPHGQHGEFPVKAGEFVSDGRLQVVLRPSDVVLPRADLIFIDAGHTYECVKADTDEAERLINRGGVITWHDYGGGHSGVTRCIDERNRDERICLVHTTSVCFKFY